jgi:hypothetical protein
MEWGYDQSQVDAVIIVVEQNLQVKHQAQPLYEPGYVISCVDNLTEGAHTYLHTYLQTTYKNHFFLITELITCKSANISTSILFTICLTIYSTYLLTFLPEKLRIVQPLRNFPAYLRNPKVLHRQRRI